MIVILAAIVLVAVLATLFGAEDRPHMKRIDVSPAIPDDGGWLEPSA